MVVRRDHTNRRRPVTSDYYVAEQWALRPRWQLSLLAPAWRVRSALRRMSPRRGPKLVCFRARPETATIVGFAQMGPPPPGALISAGRYNDQNDAVMYLAESIEGVRREVT